jgi:hypothetical protein
MSEQKKTRSADSFTDENIQHGLNILDVFIEKTNAIIESIGKGILR